MRVHTPRVNVLGVGISAINLASARAAIAGALDTRRKGYVCVTPVHGVMEARRDPELRKIFNRALLCTPDGMPMVWAGRLAGFSGVDRVYGPDLMLDICAWSRASGRSHFFYGGAQGVAELLSRKLRERFPGLRVAGTFTPPYRPLDPAEETALIEHVAAARPDLFWVGLSTPKQERFMAEYLPRLDTTIMLGVGAAFDFHTGRVRQAPRWVQRAGFEWLFRLCMEPRRLWRRYLRANPLFLALILAQITRLRKFPIEPAPDDGSPGGAGER